MLRGEGHKGGWPPPPPSSGLLLLFLLLFLLLSYSSSSLSSPCPSPHPLFLNGSPSPHLVLLLTLLLQNRLLIRVLLLLLPLFAQSLRRLGWATLLRARRFQLLFDFSCEPRYLLWGRTGPCALLLWKLSDLILPLLLLHLRLIPRFWRRLVFGTRPSTRVRLDLLLVL